MIFLSKHICVYASCRIKWILGIIWPWNQYFNLKNQRNWKKQVWTLSFLIGIICILLHWWKKLTLAKPRWEWCSQKAFHKQYLIQDYYVSDGHKILKKWRRILLQVNFKVFLDPPKTFAFQFQWIFLSYFCKSGFISKGFGKMFEELIKIKLSKIKPLLLKHRIYTSPSNKNSQ